jgi:hypothetical protein
MRFQSNLCHDPTKVANKTISTMLCSSERKKLEIPDNLLFLSLWAPIFAQANNRTLYKLIQDFQLLELLPRIIDDWGLE